jgi:hypothetical protein
VLDINISIAIDKQHRYSHHATRRSRAPLDPGSPLSILLTFSRLHRARLHPPRPKPKPAAASAHSRLSAHCLLAVVVRAAAATSDLVLLLPQPLLPPPKIQHCYSRLPNNRDYRQQSAPPLLSLTWGPPGRRRRRDLATMLSFPTIVCLSTPAGHL